VFLGLTVGCARCHDHRFDDFPQEDYYRLQAFLAATHEHNIPLADAATQADWKARTDKLSAEIKALTKQVADATGETKAALEAKLKGVRGGLPPLLPAICSVRNVEKERTEIYVLKRGLPERKGKHVGPGIPLAFDGGDLPAADRSKPRTALAHWLTDP